MISIDKQKQKLEKAVINSLKIAISEMEISKNYYSEEALRYIVVNEISKNEIWGSFPNKTKDLQLNFEFPYSKYRRIIGRFFPDITSLKFCEEGKINSINPLAVELKIKKNYNLKDINKCREYVNPKKGKHHFELAAFIVAPYKQNMNYEIFQFISRQEKKLVKAEELKILYGYIEYNKDNNPIPKTRWIW